MKYFTIDEFDQKGQPGSGANMDKEFLDKLDCLRELYRRPLYVNSGYRTPLYNKAVSETGENGPHTTGKAVDLRCIDGTDRYRLTLLALQIGFTGIGLAKSFIHLDTLTKEDKGYEDLRPRIWTYDTGEDPVKPFGSYTISGEIAFYVFQKEMLSGKSDFIKVFQRGPHSERYIFTSTSSSDKPKILVGV